LKSLSRWLSRVTPATVVGLFIVLWLGVAVLLALLRASQPWLLVYAGLTVVYAFVVGAWAWWHTRARLRGLVEEFPDSGLLLHALPSGMLLLDERGRVQAVNEAWLEMFRLPRKQVWRKSYRRFCDPILRRHIDRVSRNRKPACGLSLSTRLSDGANLMFAADIVPAGEYVLAAARAGAPESSLAASYITVDRYHRAGKVAAYFLAHLSEQLTQTGRWLREEAEPSPWSEKIDRLAEAAERLAALTDAEDEKATIFPAARWIGAIAELAEPYAREKRVALAVEIAAGLPSIKGRRVRLEHALLAVLLNGLEATPPGGTVRVASRLCGEEVEVIVDDEGLVFDPVVSERLFLPPASAQEDGPGSGLAFSRRIAREHGGDLVCQKLEPSGSRFVFWLPAANEKKERP